MPDFIVRLDGIKLTKAQQDSLAREIQSAAMREIAKIDLVSDIRIPRKDWVGLIAARRAFSNPMPGFEVKEIPGRPGR